MADNKTNKHVTLFEEVQVSRTVHAYIHNNITHDVDEYQELLTRMRNMSAHDKLIIHLSTGGGSVDAGIVILNAIKNLKKKGVHVTTVLESHAHSMGTFLFLSGDERIVSDNADMMFHNCSYGTHGKANENLSYAIHTSKSFTRMCGEYYLPFLTQDEINDIVKGNDLWLDAEQIKERLEKVKLLNSKVEEQQVTDNTSVKKPIKKVVKKSKK